MAPVADGYDVTFTVKNTSKVAAKEVAQVYVAPVSPSVPRPARELKGYDKKLIGPGASVTFTVHLDADAFAHYSTPAHAWVTDPGEYRIEVGASSADIRLSAPVRR